MLMYASATAVTVINRTVRNVLILNITLTIILIKYPVYLFTRQKYRSFSHISSEPTDFKVSSK